MEESESHTKAKYKIFDMIKALTIQQKILIIFAIIFTAAQIYSFSQFKHVPSPIFGGDFYRDRGFIQNIVTGNPIWSDGFYLNELQYYSYSVPAVLALFAIITGFTVNQVFLFYPVITALLAILAFYLLGRQVFKNETLAVLFAILIIARTMTYTVPKYSEVAYRVLLPLFLFFWLVFEENGKRKHQILAGVALGLAGLTQGGAFITGFSMLILTGLMLFLIEIKNTKNIRIIKKYAVKYGIIAIVAVIVALPYFAPLYIKYGNYQPNPVTQYGDIKIEAQGPITILQTFIGTFFDFSSFWGFGIGILILIGFLHAIINRKNFTWLFIILILISNVITLQHFLITKPILNTWFIPEKLNYLYVPFFIFAIFGLKNISTYVKANISLNKIGAIFFVIILLPTLFSAVYAYENGKWVEYGKSDDKTVSTMYEVGEWLKANVKNDESILSNDETGFGLAVLSGKKVVVSRRTHASYFVDTNERIADAAVIIYGNDTEKRKELLKKYNARYFYMDAFLLQNEMKTSRKYEDYLKKYNITFEIRVDRWDPAIPIELAYTEEMIVIKPNRISEAFISITTPLREFKIGNNTFSIIFKINYN